MGDYIQHQSALDAIEAERKAVHHASQMECTEEACHDEYVITRALERLAVRVQIIPSADVRPVVRGRWIKQDDDPLDGNFYCSACHSGIDIATGSETPIDREMFYCPSCGADMRGESGSEEKILHQI